MLSVRMCIAHALLNHKSVKALYLSSQLDDSVEYSASRNDELDCAFICSPLARLALLARPSGTALLRLGTASQDAALAVPLLIRN